MLSTDTLHAELRNWRTILGEHPRIGAEQPGRQLWPVTAKDGREYMLKQISPWRNLPLADEARILAYLVRSGLRVAEFLVTEDAQLYAEGSEGSFVLLPYLAHDQIPPDASLPVEGLLGHFVAHLHQSLASYPWSANSYHERIVEGLRSELLLPEDLQDPFGQRRVEIIERLEPLDRQLVHGDLTPDNILVSRDEHAAAFIDFDHLPLAPRVWDIGKYLSRRLRRLEPAAALQNVDQFVTGYHRTSSLTEAELFAVPAAIAATNLLEASWTASILSGRLDRRLLPEQKAELEPTLDTLRWQFRHDGELAAAVGSGTGSM